jgi:hypothetical protein
MLDLVVHALVDISVAVVVHLRSHVPDVFGILDPGVAGVTARDVDLKLSLVLDVSSFATPELAILVSMVILEARP